MADSIRIKEIHAAIDAGKYGDGRTANLAWHIAEIAKILGNHSDKDGNPISINQRKFVKEGAQLPGGYHFGQWGSEGIAVESIPNRFVIDPFGRKKLEAGGAVLCHTLPQMLAEYLDQLDASLGLQEGAAFEIQNTDGSRKIAQFEGLHALLADVAYSVSQISQNSSQAQISSLKTQAISKEILRGLGLPIVTKTFSLDVGEKKKARVPFPGLALDSPSITRMLGWGLRGQSILVGHKVKE